MRPIHLLFGIVMTLQAQPVLGQASFALRNSDPWVGLNAPVYDWAGGLLAGDDWRAELYGGVEPDSLSPLWSIHYLRREIVPLIAPGYFISTDGSLSVLAAPPLGWAWLELKVWDVRLGPTYEEAAAKGLGGYGQSPPFYAQGGDPTAALPTLPFPLVGLESFSVLQVIPEPSTLALIALGGALGFGVGGCTRTRRPGAPDPRCARPHSGG
jgi:hypothetical protein